MNEPVEPLEAFRPSKAMVSSHQFCIQVADLTNVQVYAGVFPIDSNDFLKLEESIKRVRKYPSFWIWLFTLVSLVNAYGP